MPALVGEGEHRVQRVVVVEQLERADAVDPRAVGPGDLALGLVDVDPAAGDEAAVAREVVSPQRRQRLQHQ
ncbi:hypothetical protein RZS08_63575, partial [Arthrospira platensis SPKY1]|nr:hypothetical protein [Arthrospira platensis SPKY1]